jgi:hypothetical protein
VLLDRIAELARALFLVPRPLPFRWQSRHRVTVVREDRPGRCPCYCACGRNAGIKETAQPSDNDKCGTHRRGRSHNSRDKGIHTVPRPGAQLAVECAQEMRMDRTPRGGSFIVRPLSMKMSGVRLWTTAIFATLSRVAVYLATTPLGGFDPTQGIGASSHLGEFPAHRIAGAAHEQTPRTTLYRLSRALSDLCVVAGN